MASRQSLVESRRARGLFFRRALENAARRRARRLLVVNRERYAAKNLKGDENSANLKIHCHMP